MPRYSLLIATALAGAVAATAQVGLRHAHSDTIFVMERVPGGLDSLGRTFIIIEGDTLHTSFIPDPYGPKHTGPLTDEDYTDIADYIGVEPAAIRAVVDIETGRTRRGFHAEGKPVINFDLSVFRRAAARRGIKLSKHKSSPALQPVNIRKYGSQQAAQQARLDAAMAIDSIAAIESTFWGMFQIGGFNYKLCGAESRDEFIRLMSRSEYDQLRLFASYLVNTGLLEHLKSKNWAAFARRYNGPSYAARGYHTRMAEAYRKHSRK
ncbi:MAG: N-acetylmuramidase family protein [Muribaculaceae bacterium]|nr:N-acetylmuramidase family protein [Muribaculaceae bacterium]